VSLLLVIGPDGRVGLPAGESQAAGLAPGDALRLAAGPGTVLLARGEEGSAWLAGSLAATSFGEVALLVAGSLKTGVLQISVEGRSGRQRKTIHFREGRVVFAASSDPADRLGVVLVRVGLVGAALLAECTPAVIPGRPLGQVLVERGALTAGQLYEGMVHQVREIFFSLFAEARGEFLFREGPLDGKSEVRLPERTRDLILAGLKRASDAEWAAAAPEPAQEPPQGAPAPPPEPGGPFDAYRRLFRAIYAPLRLVETDARERLDTGIDRLPAAQRPFFQGIRFGEGGELDVGRVLSNAAAAGYAGAAARAKALESLEALLTFALFEARNRLPAAEAEALRREVGRIQMGER